jgi:hypothetical protein
MLMYSQEKVQSTDSEAWQWLVALSSHESVPHCNKMAPANLFDFFKQYHLKIK